MPNPYQEPPMSDSEAEECLEKLGGCDNGHWAHYENKSNHPCVNWTPIDWDSLNWEGLGFDAG